MNNTAEVKRKQRLIREKVFELQYSLEGRIERDGPLQKKPWVSVKGSGTLLTHSPNLTHSLT